MKKWWYVGVYIASMSHNIAQSAEEVTWKDYVYDEEGIAQFIKVYLAQQQPPKAWTRMTQEDRCGRFLAIPIKKKRNSDDDEDTWECPYCYTINPASRNVCSNPDCILYRKKGRDW